MVQVFYTTLISVDLAYCEIFMLKLSFSGEGDSAKSDGCSIILQDGGLFEKKKTIKKNKNYNNNNAS